MHWVGLGELPELLYHLRHHVDSNSVNKNNAAETEVKESYLTSFFSTAWKHKEKISIAIGVDSLVAGLTSQYL
ncbi:hypothetical protein [Legionella jamestowniensis]|uniref:Uncharacterized protein n=1 Tax=Legionella jamestowniensis TaxID=455 RepID=A0A0W0UZY5_9GAMM|nr:hypothetical protein [Legionella jamestowniensis]KTD13404.1 hypothetical protein Ljam_0194 [Legionella jamestowniensis]OCH98425.1 hypothetical protein A8135_12815 [Legionella jamestowniensis]SFL75912.1 hypothetical protein SAMN02746073_1732 [Legionella jamestowniensis DSM 19215]